MRTGFLTHRAAKQQLSCATDDLEVREKLIAAPFPASDAPPKQSRSERRRKILLWGTRLFVSIAVVVLLMLLVFGALYTGIYERDPTCPVEEWSYEPWCADAITHHNTSNLQAPLTPEQWRDLRAKYQQAVGTANSTLSSNWDDLYKNLPAPYNQRVHNSGYLIPIEIKSTADKGRGVFTKVDIKKGQKIWDNRFRAVFPTPCSAMKFFADLTNEQACDALFWGYVHNFYGNGYQFMLALDGHDYTNHGTSQNGLENIEHHFEEEMDQSYYQRWLPFVHRLSGEKKAKRNKAGAYGLFAIRDISAGEGKILLLVTLQFMNVLFLLN